MKKLEALFNAVIVKPLENDEQTYGSIVIPNLGEETNKRAEVIAVGPGHYSVTGNFMETTLKEGDEVVLPSMGFTKFQFEGETYYIGKENEVLGKIKK